MRVLIAPDKFKGSLSADEAAGVIARVVAELGHEAQFCPISDGGEGFLDAMLSASSGSPRFAEVTGPMGEKVRAAWGLIEQGGRRIGVVEMARAAGLQLVSGRRDPLRATTFGVGELLLAAHEAGAEEILLGIGGSATVDAGLGCCQAVGHTVLRRDGEPVAPGEPLRAADLPDVYMIKRGRGSVMDRVPIRVACDVTAPLYGPLGAARVFAAQKGASPEEIDWLDREHEALARRCMKLDEASTPGAGAAGGIGWALLSFFNAALVPGFDLVAGALGLRERVEQADLVVTGEGCFDASSLQGKGPTGVATLCTELGKPCVLLAGRIEATTQGRFAHAEQVTPAGTPMDVATRQAPQLLAEAARRALLAYTTRPR